MASPFAVCTTDYGTEPWDSLSAISGFLPGQGAVESVWPPMLPVASKNLAAIYAAALLRTTGVGLTGVLLAVYASRLGLTLGQIGLLVTAGLAAGTAASAFVSFHADRLGRRSTLVVLSLLATAGGAGFAFANHPIALLLLSFIGMVNGSGTDRGPCFILEHAIIPQTAAAQERTNALAWYSIVMDIGHALGALLAGLPFLLSRWLALDLLPAYRWTFAVYALLNLLSAAIYLLPHISIELHHAETTAEAPHPTVHSRHIVYRLAALFAVDSFGGGFLTDALLAYWFFHRFGISVASLGLLFAVGNALNSFSYLGAAALAKRIGLLKTMVFTHIPSSVLLMLVPLAPDAFWAIVFYLAWESLVEMDVPTRQSFLMAVVAPKDRTFSTGITNLSRNTARALSPTLAGYAMQHLAMAAPLFFGGSLKILYDVVLYAAFRRVQPPEE